MHSSQSSNSQQTVENVDASADRKIKGKDILYCIITWILRIVLGAVFLFSGFTKGVDPWGSLYKVNDYLAALGISMPGSVVLVGVFLLCIIEFLIGMSLLLGCYRRSAPIGALLMMAIMLPLSLWIAIADPVADCGCFGDALLISNWATFGKNIAITAGLIWIVKFNLRYKGLISPAFQWMAVIASGAYLAIIGLWGYQVQPLIDFRQYKIGTSLISEDSHSEDPSFIFVYEKNGKKYEFSDTDIIPDDPEYKFIERREIYSDNSEKEKLSGDFRVWDRDVEEDVTDEAIDSEGKQILILIPSVKDISASTTWKINALHDWASNHNIDVDAVVAADSGDLDEWEDLSMPQYDIYISDDTVIKEVARGNPAIVYLVNGKVGWKSTLAALDDAYFDNPKENSDINKFSRDYSTILRNMTVIYTAVMILLIIISMIPRIAGRFHPWQLKKLRSNHGDKALHEESSSHDTTVR